MSRAGGGIRGGEPLDEEEQLHNGVQVLAAAAEPGQLDGGSEARVPEEIIKDIDN